MMVVQPADWRDAISVAVSPLSWVNEVLEDLGRDTPPERCLLEARQAGYEGVELSRIFPREPDRLKALLGAHGQQLVSGWHSGRLAEIGVDEELKLVASHAALLSACGAEVMVYGETGLMVPDALDAPMGARRPMPPSDVGAYGARLTAFAERLADRYGLALAYHHHLMTIAETLEETAAILDASGPAVGLLLDTGHAAAAGFDYGRLIDAFGDRINHIHLKDVRTDVLAGVRADGLSFNQGVLGGMFTVPGDGTVDFAPIAAFLATGCYRGWLVVEAEQDPSVAPPLATVDRARRFVASDILGEGP